MRISTIFRLLLAGLLFTLILAPTSGWASSVTNCPPEPTQNVGVVSGQTYSGANCLLKTTGDVDSFTFTAAAGDTWRIVTSVAGSVTANICLDVYAPGSTGTPIFQGCTGIGAGGLPAVEDNQGTASAGVYTAVVKEANNANQQFAVSLERINPTPPDAATLSLSTSVTAQVAAPTAQNAYKFYGSTTGIYQVNASYLSGADNVCFDIYGPGATVVTTACTGVGAGGLATISANVTPKQNTWYLVLIHTASNASTTNYNLEVSCYLGTCNPPPPTCALKDALSYNATNQTLTMTFTVATPVTATWNGWLVNAGNVQSIFSQSLPVTEPPTTKVKTKTGVVKSGVIGVLSTLYNSNGITCSSWNLVNTGH